MAVKPQYKDAALLFLLRNVIPQDESTILFVSTKHHVEYLQEFLTRLNISNTYIYGSLDQEARKIHIQNFRNGKVKLLIVTDVAARGIDIPYLDNVINYDFSDKSKVFVHRVGRAARNGRSGKAYSIITTDDVNV
jgi:ATP-dependent RNA helicase DDX54/DBP10